MNCEKLPGNYRYAATMDFVRNRKQMRAVMILSLILIAAPALAGLALSPIPPAWRFMMDHWYLWFALAAALVIYIPLHELTHGAAMYALSGVKPSYGRTHILTALAPVVFWGVVLAALAAALPREWFWPIWIVQISNLSGSAGDIYCAWVLARMEGDLLIQDTGVRMRIFRKKDPIEDRA